MNDKTRKIEDFGEHIAGAKKDQYDTGSMSDNDLYKQTLTKLWPKKQVTQIEDKELAALATAFRDTLPKKPTSKIDDFEHHLKLWVTEVLWRKSLIDICLEGKISARQEMLELASYGPSTYLKANLLSQIDRQNWSRIGNLENIRDRREAGLKVDNIWVTINKDNDLDQQAQDLLDGVSHHLEANPSVSKKYPDFTVWNNGAVKPRFCIAPRCKISNYDKGEPELMVFDSRDEALAALKDTQHIHALWDAHQEAHKVTKGAMRHKDNSPRDGADYRAGRDISPDEFMQTFNIRGGQFGNWVADSERPALLNNAYDAFMDLAKAVNIPPSAIGLDGNLAIAFGARGGGNASAHYEPSQNIINLTKTRGAGSLAHEWWHALDHYMGDYKTFMSKNPHNTGRYEETSEAVLDLIQTISRSDLYVRSKKADNARSGTYFGDNIEMTARAFEGYVKHRLEQNAGHNDFLVNIVAPNEWHASQSVYPYPLDGEFEMLSVHYDKVFDALQVDASFDRIGLMANDYEARAQEVKKVHLPEPELGFNWDQNPLNADTAQKAPSQAQESLVLESEPSQDQEMPQTADVDNASSATSVPVQDIEQAPDVQAPNSHGGNLEATQNIESAPAPQEASQSAVNVDPPEPEAIQAPKTPEQEQDEYTQETLSRLGLQTQAGQAPWQQQRLALGAMVNVDGVAYRGLNQYNLQAIAQEKGYTSNRWMTYKAARDLGAYVKRGEKAAKVYYWQPREEASDKTDDKAQEGKSRHIFRKHNVFNVDQIEGLDKSAHLSQERRLPDYQGVMDLADAMGVKVARTKDDISHYKAASDTIYMPHPAEYPSQSAYYSALLHEISAASMHPDRLGGADNASFDALKSAMDAVHLAGAFGIDYTPKDDSALHQDWAHIIQNQHKEFLTATKPIRQDYILAIYEAHKEAAQIVKTPSAFMRRFEDVIAPYSPDVRAFALDVMQNLDAGFAAGDPAKDNLEIWACNLCARHLDNPAALMHSFTRVKDALPDIIAGKIPIKPQTPDKVALASQIGAMTSHMPQAVRDIVTQTAVKIDQGLEDSRHYLEVWARNVCQRYSDAPDKLMIVFAQVDAALPDIIAGKKEVKEQTPHDGLGR